MAKQQIGKPRRARKPKAEKDAATSDQAGQSGNFASNQPPIKGMEDTDERIPELEEACQAALMYDEQKKNAKKSKDEQYEKIGNLLNEHSLKLYILNGKKFYIEPGGPSVKCVNVKQNG